jgi:DNA-binding transcriptional LysR family regulator
MTLTPKAEGLIEPVRDVLLKAEEIHSSTPDFNPATSTRTFRIRMSDYVETVLLTEAVALVQKVAPGVKLDLLSLVDGGFEALERGEIDLSITPKSYVSPKHPLEHLFEDEFVCLVWSGNKLVRERISRELYLTLGHVVVRFGKDRELPTVEEWILERFGSQRRIEVITSRFSLVPKLLVGTTRIATLHRRLSAFYAQYLPLKLLRPPFEMLRLEECVQWHKSRDNDPGIIWLRTILKTAAQATASRRRADRVPA